MRTRPLRVHVLFLFYTVTFTHHAMAGQNQARLGGDEPNPNVDDPYVVEVGKFAVAEHNKEAGQALVFALVVSGERLVVDGELYKLVIEAEEAGAGEAFEAVVNDVPWDKSKVLISFEALH